jgi:intraflagellar transport protein 46
MSEDGDFRNDFAGGRGKAQANDFDDDFDDEFSASTANQQEPGGATNFNDSQMIANQHHDEAVELSDEDSHNSPAMAQAMRRTGMPAGRDDADAAGRDHDADADGVVKNKPFDEALELSSEESRCSDDMREGGARESGRPIAARMEHATGQYRDADADAQDAAARGGREQEASEDEGSEEEGSDDDGGVGVREVNAGAHEGGGGVEAIVPGQYDPAEYEHLPVSSEIKELFQYIGRYSPHNIELETKMRPFIPDYIPAVGEIDPFVKVPRPDGEPDALGLTVLDEPASHQSDAIVMQLQLRAITKASSHQPVAVRSIESAEKDPRAVRAWVDSIKELHRNKPQPSVSYSKPMPDIEELMQVRGRKGRRASAEPRARRAWPRRRGATPVCVCVCVRARIERTRVGRVCCARCCAMSARVRVRTAQASERASE